MMGLVVAERLTRAGHHVTVFEQGNQLGGLSTWYDYGECIWDKFYHVILPSDRLLIELIQQLGLGPSLQWCQGRTGFFQDRRHYSVSNNLEFLRFPLLSPLQKIRLAWTFIYGSRVDDWKNLEKMTTEDWLIRHSGRATYEAFWRPMLLAKLGMHYRSVSAVFIWSYIKRLFSVRDPAVGKEQLGHVRGGYRTVIEALVSRVQKTGEFRLGHTVQRVWVGEHNRLFLGANDRQEDFDRIVFTGPANILNQVISGDLVDVEGPLDQVRYLGVICLVLLTRIPLTPFYVLNIADEELPFTGVIGMSSVVPIEETGNRYLTYFPRYLDFSDPMFERDDSELVSQFLPAVKRLFPDLRNEDISSSHINRARVVQPLQVLNYSRYVPRITTRHPGLFILNTGQFANNTVHNNEVVRLVSEFFETNAGAFRGNSIEPT